MHGEIFNAEMELVFLNSTDVTGKVIVTTEGMSTNVVSYIITKILSHFIYRATIAFGIPNYIFFSKNVLRETTAFSVMMENASLSISNAMVIETAGMEAMKKIVD